MPRPAVRAAGAVILGAVLYAYGSTSEVSWLFLVAYWSWALVAAALLYTAWAARGVGVEFEVVPDAGEGRPELPAALEAAAPAPPVFEGDRLRLRALVRARGRARGPVRVTADVGAAAVDVAVPAAGRAGTAVERDLGLARRGVVNLASARLEVGDPLGLFRAVRRLPGRELAVVLPRFAALPEARRPDEIEDAFAARRAGSGLELFGAREYRPGDPLRRIHWRLSARRPGATLVVREYEPPGRRSLLLVLDGAPRPEAADQAARVAASEAWTCLREGGQAALWAAGRQATHPRDGLWELLEWLARWPGLDGDEGGAPRASEVVAVTTDGTALETIDLGRIGPARAWLVGERAPEADVPARRVGLDWPL